MSAGKPDDRAPDAVPDDPSDLRETIAEADLASSLPDVALREVAAPEWCGRGGFLSLRTRRLVARYEDGSESAPFAYDEVSRRALDAVVMVAYFVRDAEPHVYVRSALRPPLRFRDAEASPVAEPQTGALWELPAGLVEPEEPGLAGVVAAARRELAEELGFVASPGQFSALGPATLACAGIIAERLFFVAVAVDPSRRGRPTLDGSALERAGAVRAISLSQALAACRTGAIEDAKTEIGIRRLAEARVWTAE